MVTKGHYYSTSSGGTLAARDAEVWFGLSADSRPDGAGNGSAFIEMDTGKLYFYDADGTQWLEWDA